MLTCNIEQRGILDTILVLCVDPKRTKLRVEMKAHAVSRYCGLGISFHKAPGTPIHRNAGRRANHCDLAQT